MDTANATIFRSLNRDQKSFIRRAMGAPATIKPGEYLFRLGEVGSDLFEIVEGKLEVTALTVEGSALVLGTIGPGDIVGEVAPILGGARTASVRALEPTKYRKLGREAFWRVLEEYPSVALDALRIVATRLQSATLDARGLHAGTEKKVTPPLWDRLAESTLHLAAHPLWGLSHVVFFAVWLWWNWQFSHGVSADKLPWWVPDPPPYGMLTMIVSLEAIFLAILVLVGQYRQAEQTAELKREETRQFNHMNELIAQTRVAVEDIQKRLKPPSH